MSNAERIVVAMSGGVDSSVAAALLVEQGYSVSGVMLKLWSDEQTCADNSCCPPEAIAQARQVAGLLGIPFYVIDVRELFRREIVDEFLAGYRQGITPNPCFLCNRSIRWGFLLDRIISTGSNRIATGHYARLKNVNGNFQLLKGIDPTKDQSYVLAGLNQAQLSHSLFPLGDLKKTEVREIARKFNLPVAEKHDSQDLCFVGASGYRDFIKRHSPESCQSGIIRFKSGEVIGAHDGLFNYTIGQRKGLPAGFPQPIYVIEKNIDSNEVVVGFKNELGSRSFTAVLQQWSGGSNPEEGIQCEVKTRYKTPYLNATITKLEDNTLTITLDKVQRDITPGQIAVYYKGEQVLGSAVIESTFGIGEEQ